MLKIKLLTMQKTILVFILAIFLSQASAQQYNFSSFSVNEGLTQSQARTIIEDDNGYLWIGTKTGGISVFDGINFKTYSTLDGLSSNYIESLFEDADKNIWIGTNDGGLNVFDGNTFNHFNQDSVLPANTILAITQDDKKNIWIGTMDNGVFIYENNKFKLVEIAVNTISVNCMLFDNLGNLWIGTKNNGIYIKTADGIKHLTTNNKLLSNTINSIFQDNLGKMWIASKQGVNVIDRWAVSIFENEKLNNKNIADIYVKENGNKWFSILDVGVSLIKKDEQILFDSNNGLNSSRINCILKDKTDNIWFGTDGGGIQKFESEQFRSISTKDNEIKDMAMSFCEDDENRIWIATHGSGAYRWEKDGTFTHFSTQNGLFSDALYHVFNDSKGNIWFGTKGDGAGFYDGKHFKQLSTKNDFFSDNIYSIAEDKNGNIWFSSTDNGITFYNGLEYTNFRYFNGLSTNRTWKLFFDSKGNLWVATNNGGIDFIDAKYIDNITKDQTLSKYQIKNYSKKNFLNSNDIVTVGEDVAGNVWIGTFGAGVYKYNGKEFINFSTQEGILSNDIYLLVSDKQNNMWLGTEKGVSRIKANSTSDNLNIKNYTRNDGFVGIETNIDAGFRDKNGDLWFGTIDGLTICKPNLVVENTVKPKINITNIKLFFEEVSWTNYTKEINHFGLPKSLNLEYNNNHLTFDFIAVDLKSPQNVEYQWKMEGFDEKWSPISKKTEATYSNISHGKYTFKVRAANGDGLWNDKSAEFTFEIFPPFWQTWWFYSIMGISFIILLLGYIKWREDKLKKEKVILEEKVKTRTILLSQEKEKVVKQSEKLTKQAKVLEETNVELEKLSIVARETDNSVLIANSDFEIEWANEGFTRLYGYTLKEFKEKIGGNLLDASSNPNIKEIIRNCLTSKTSVVYDIPSYTKIGRKIWTQTNLTPIVDINGTVNKLVAIDSDITDIKIAEEEIKQQNEEILAQRDRLSEVNETLQEINTKITDSIYYAKKIQHAILPSKKYFKELFPESFVFFKPRDIVSGDFFWIAEHGNMKFVAAGDCTGHGVPGALMSMIGNTLLNEIVNEKKIFKPGEILDHLNTGVLNALDQNDDNNDMQTDGMDVTICCIYKDSQEIEVACANHFSFLVSDSISKILHGDMYSIGDMFIKNKKFNFTSHRAKFKKGDIIYLFSDGYQDQFGGDKNTKFLTGNFIDLLKNNSNKSMTEQQEIINTTFDEWMGYRKQIDDILVMGIKMT